MFVTWGTGVLMKKSRSVKVKSTRQKKSSRRYQIINEKKAGFRFSLIAAKMPAWRLTQRDPWEWHIFPLVSHLSIHPNGRTDSWVGYAQTARDGI